MFFCIIGNNNSEIVLEGLRYIRPKNLRHTKANILVFETEFPDRIQYCGGVIKRGTVVDSSHIQEETKDITLLGVENKDIGSLLKKQLSHIKRYKIIDLIHSDLEVKKEGKEIINIDGKQWGIVHGYQNIELYETIDFGKPVGGMTVGMMPSKLAHQLINIAVAEYEDNIDSKDNIQTRLTIRDPFCGFGTTNFLANHLKYNTIASDLNVTSIKQNMKWRKQLSLSDTASKVKIEKQDITQKLSPAFSHTNIIVSEGWLGHIITNATWPKEAENSSIAVEKLYKDFFNNLSKFLTNNTKSITLVITIPVWIKHNHNFSVSESITQHAKSLGRETTLLMKPYFRKGQLVARQVLIGNFKPQ